MVARSMGTPVPPLRLCEFGYPGPLRDRLVAAVLAGVKTATTSLLDEWAREGEALPSPGERQLVVDSAERPIATIEILSVETIRLGDADLRLALDEGEGFADVAAWRAAHEGFWQGAVTDETLLVVERFRLVSASASG
jgi:uncharacterized protein YhfF